MESKAQAPINESPSDCVAAQPERFALDEEKQVQAVQVEDSDSLRKINSIGIDVTNRDAVKGDESDGKVNWTWLQIAATACLSGLYVGMCG